MMVRNKIYLPVLLLMFLISTSVAETFSPEKMVTAISEQVQHKNNLFDGRWPEYTIDGKWKYRKNVNWFSGFLPGELWNMYAITGNETLKQAALKISEALVPYASIDYSHDMGFIYLPSCVEAYRVTGRMEFRDAGLTAAKMLAKRFNPKGKFIRAWGALASPDRAGTMIIDTMMNLELLFWAAEESGDWPYYDIAFTHAITCLNESIRDDASSHHVLEFDPESGELVSKHTHQGYSDESTWARGQAWGIYGFANAYRRTGYEKFRAVSIRMTDYMIARLPDDFAPYWDLDLKGDGVIRDASAGAILASGLYMLAGQVEYRQQQEQYLQTADRIVESLLEKYLFLHSSREEEQGLLIHSVYNFNSNYGVDESYPAGDYYLTEALRKYMDRYRTRYQIRPDGIRTSIDLNKGWFYLEDALTSVDQLSKSEASWQCVDLPHTWNRWDVTDHLPGYRRSAGWYEKIVYIPELYDQGRYLLDFEGANITTDVYVNGQFCRRHVGGYLGFQADITDFLAAGADNRISVRVDNSYNRDIIPSQKSDFFIYGGITRDVRLLIVPDLRLGNCVIRTPGVSGKKATVLINGELEYGQNLQQLSVQIQLKDPTGKVVSEKSQPIKKQAETKTWSVQLPGIKNPSLWSPDDPNLYTAVITLKKDNTVLDRKEERFGLRWFEFRENGPFYLNGERLLLRGTHRHEEHAGYGAAMSNEMHRRDMEMIKEMGANFIRLAHYPQDPEVYTACDELGLLVWDELPWCRGGMGGEVWKANTIQMLQEQIRQNVNHPSIILWSLGNELYWLPDYEGGADNDSLRQFLGELNTLAHNLDPARPTALRKYYEGADIVDVFSPSIWAGWYSGVYKNYEKALEDARGKYKRFFHAEYGGSSHPGRHDENPVSGEGIIEKEGWEEVPNQVKVKNIAQFGDWSENYMVDLFDWHIHVAEGLEWFTGNAQWAFKDFGTPLRPENAIPYVNQKGVVDRAGNPKDAWYVFKSYWTQTPYFCYIESHTWNERQGPPGTNRQVCVFSNCGEVELLLNGESYGKIRRNPDVFPAAGLSWDIPFREGENELLAKGFEDGVPVTMDSLKIQYFQTPSGSPDRITLSAERVSAQDWQIEAVVVDKTGRRCLDYNKRIYFSCDGEGDLYGDYGTPDRSTVIEMANGRAEIMCQAFPGLALTIEARNQDFKGSYLILNESGR